MVPAAQELHQYSQTFQLKTIHNSVLHIDFLRLMTFELPRKWMGFLWGHILNPCVQLISGFCSSFPRLSDKQCNLVLHNCYCSPGSQRNSTYNSIKELLHMHVLQNLNLHMLHWEKTVSRWRKLPETLCLLAGWRKLDCHIPLLHTGYGEET